MRFIHRIILRRRRRHVFTALVGIFPAYLLLAYGALPAWYRFQHQHPGLESAPRVTTTSVGLPGDPLNIALVGTSDQVDQAFRAAVWYPADRTTIETSCLICLSVTLR